MDLNVRAFRTVHAALDEHSTEVTPQQAASRKGGLVGGPARAQSMSAKRRREIARKASKARWHKTSTSTESSKMDGQ
jgi:hypothetical protein